ncbi:hypothetical protein NQ318_001451 [Aromia moschata]|uniref:Aconitate hydratase n=1 Tax=Aromia moschata TaxID=1265417 RepID=A0AAV8YXL2_9CUCU|nr:hypothetical protein NQ318_001451 [Aromia moschata]
MINGLGVLGWGVGGIEAEAVMLDQSISMLLPEVVGYKLYGELNQYVTSTDLVLTVTKNLRQLGVVNKFVEFYGPGVTALSIADRATIANMCPEYGATVGFFPVDEISLKYLRQTNRSEEQIKLIEAYLRATRQLRNYSSGDNEPVFSQTVGLDLSTVVSSVSGPKRPNDRVSVVDMKQDFLSCLTNKIGFKGFGIPDNKLSTTAKFMYDGTQYQITHGSVIIAAITSCTNTSNPSVMLGAGLLAKNAVAAGLSVAPYIKTSLSPGSGVVTYYLQESGVIPALEKLGFDIVGYGCMTCIGNSGGLDENIANAIEQNDLVCCGVANYLASPLLVIAYAIAGRVDFDFETEPLGKRAGRQRRLLEGHLADPQGDPCRRAAARYSSHVQGGVFQNRKGKWQALTAPSSTLYPWDSSSTYIKKPPYFDGITRDLPTPKPIIGARVLLLLGDSVTTDHISPAGSIGRSSPARKGIRAVIAESFERIHRSNLVGMGVVPLQFQPGENPESLGLTGKENYTINIPDNLKPGQHITVSTDTGKNFNVILRFDTEVDLLFYKHGGILNYMIRKMLN